MNKKIDINTGLKTVKNYTTINSFWMKVHQNEKKLIYVNSWKKVFLSYIYWLSDMRTLFIQKTEHVNSFANLAEWINDPYLNGECFARKTDLSG